jgi:hypothetical protein
MLITHTDFRSDLNTRQRNQMSEIFRTIKYPTEKQYLDMAATISAQPAACAKYFGTMRSNLANERAFYLDVQKNAELIPSDVLDMLPSAITSFDPPECFWGGFKGHQHIVLLFDSDISKALAKRHVHALCATLFLTMRDPSVSGGKRASSGSDCESEHDTQETENSDGGDSDSD